ncbi:hypothetical protein [Nonomuraea sp. NPDC048826]|uniref:hypothetical protein n=1 Tax=Nonomuraea sp. NPDC048826 TaxID=3364347 RepID=UPI00371A88C9
MGEPGGGWRPPPRGGGGKKALIAVIAGLAVIMLVAVAAAGWWFLRAGDGGREAAPGRTTNRSSGKPKPSRSAAAVKLRPISGDQLCAAVPGALRESLVADGKYGGRDAATPSATAEEKRASCSWRNSKMDVGNGVIGHRVLTVAVRATATAGHAESRFAQDKETHRRRVNVRDGKRVDGRTTGSAFGDLRELRYGDESYSQSSAGRTGLKAAVFVRQGPWLIQIEYGGSNRTRPELLTGDAVRAAAGKVAALVTAEMARDAGEVKVTGPCAVLAVDDVRAALFPEVSGPSVKSTDGRVPQTVCAWTVREPVEHEPGQEYTARGGSLNAHVADWGSAAQAAYQFDRNAKKYDRYRAKGGIGDDRIRTTYEARERLPGLGDGAFAVVSTTVRPGRADEPPRSEILVEVLAGAKTVELTYRGTTTGGGVVTAQGYKEPAFEAAVARDALLKLAKPFADGLR